MTNINEPIPGASNPQEDPTALDFTTFVTQKGYIKDTIDLKNMFAVREHNAEYLRDYYLSNPSGGFSRSPMYEVWMSKLGTRLTKRGRQIPVGEGFHREEESVWFSSDMAYSLEHIKGQADYEGSINSIDVRFLNDGELELFSVETHDSKLVTSDGVAREGLENHFSKSGDVFITRCGSGATVLCENNGDSYIFYLVSPQGKPEQKVVVSKKIDSAEDLMDEWGIKNLQKDPMQPPHGRAGESHGDNLWKYDNFSSKMGVRVTPIDTPDEMRDFDKKGFRELVASIAKQV